MRRPAHLALAIAVVLLLGAAPARAEDTGWVIEAFDADIEIQGDGAIAVEERIAVDFVGLQRHGIFRSIPVQYEWDDATRTIRVYDLEVLHVRDAQGRPWRYETSMVGALIQIKIGDPGHTVSGKQTYVIGYRVRGALNGFTGHDELYWNVTGPDWPVPMLRSSATVRAPGALSDRTCYVGLTGSHMRCADVRDLARGAVFTTGRALAPGEQLTIVAALPKGVVREPVPILRERPRRVEEFFDLAPPWVALAALVAAVGSALVVWLWWTAGRDRPERVTIVPEYEPPEKLRPAQLGLVIDERADPLDVTATIVDLAVRGHLAIVEEPKRGLFGSRDWVLTRGAKAHDTLLPYERTIFHGLFRADAEAADGSTRLASVKLSSLKEKFYTTLRQAQRELYRDAVARGWFPLDPSHVRTGYAGAGVGLLVVAVALALGLGFLGGAGLVGVGAVAPALGLIALSPAMPRKTRDGAELMRRTLGFKRYMEVAETERQRFAEREQIFSEYLPYAIVFGCVDRWARAFEGIDMRDATATWYTGSSLGAFSAMDMSRGLSSFSNEVSTAIVSTPGGGGGSGFGGGAGGGGGGGGGGSW